MRSLGKWIGRVFVLVIVTVAALWFLVPRDRMDPTLDFDAAALPEDLDAWLAAREAVIPDIVPGAGKAIVWAGEPGVRTAMAVVYVHGFSATWHEIAPVPQDVARALGANLYLTRLAGHGRDGAAMATASPEDWMTDLAEALAIGRRLGDRVLIIATSTGATLATVGLADPAGARDVAGAVFVSPNYRLASVAGAILDMPLARHWGPWVAGAERAFTPVNADHARWWTTRYPTAALFPMATLMRHARALDFGAMTVPLLVIRSPQDRVVDAGASAAVVSAWGAPARLVEPDLTPADDPYAHVIAGDVLSPGQTAWATALILDWARGL
ncbi:MAG: alpha/beta fold hydrolase [Paracoccaceae bacterium]|nr:MAG: alpha/beta fold hydrolase [Paracoccaceae bacterium]